MEWWTIAMDGEIGYFGTTADKAKAMRIAALYQWRYPDHGYEVVPEDDDEPKRETL